jgi:hypothetical protein
MFMFTSETSSVYARSSVYSFTWLSASSTLVFDVVYVCVIHMILVYALLRPTPIHRLSEEYYGFRTHLGIDKQNI